MLISPTRHVLFPYQNHLSFQDKNRPALFLDRDGIIIKEKHYLSSPRQVELEFFVNEFISFYRRKGWLIIVVTNQSGISRGYFNWEQYEIITNKMLQFIDPDCHPDAIYANSGLDHKCEPWRKPEPGMIFQAIIDFTMIDLSKSLIIGDKVSDLLAGFNAGIKRNILLKTGHGLRESMELLDISRGNKVEKINISFAKEYANFDKFKNTLQIYEDLKGCFDGLYLHSNTSK